jgi:TRAP-type C4-dicarboxylate transport system substrate-binding protein
MLPAIAALVALAFPAAAQEAVVTGITYPNTITDEQWKVFQANVADGADPPLPLKMLVRGEVGSEEAMITATRRGRVQLTAPSMSATTSVVPELGVFSLPYLFDSVEQMDAILETAARDEARRLLAAKGFEFLNWIDSGWVGFYGKEPLTAPETVTGYKLRTPTVIAAQEMAQVLKADAVYIPYPDIIPSLQTGLIRGGITSDYPYSTGGINTEAPFFVYTRHTYDAGLFFANKTWFDGLSAANQALLRVAYGDPVDFRGRVRDYSAREMEQLKAKGVQVIELRADQRARWVEATRPVHRRVLDRLGPDAARVYDAIQSAKRR